MYCRRQSEHMDLDAGSPLVAVAIDKDKGSQNALKWAVDNLVTRGQTLALIHVKITSHPTTNQHDAGCYREPTDHHSKELFLPFRCFCTRKDVRCKDVLLEDLDVAKAIIEFVGHGAIEKLVVGASSKGGLVRRFKNHDVTASITKGVPDFCTGYVIAKGKVSAMRNAVRPAPHMSPLRSQIQSQASLKPDVTSPNFFPGSKGSSSPSPSSSALSSRLNDQFLQGQARIILTDMDAYSVSLWKRSPFGRGMRGATTKSFADLSLSDTDISFVSSGRPSTDQAFPPRLSNGSEGLDRSFEMRTPHKSVDSYSTGNEFSSISLGSTGTSWSSQAMEDVEEEMKRLRLELKHTMDMYNNACKEALTAKQKLQRWKMEEEKKISEAHAAEIAAMALVEKEKAKCRAAMEAAQAENRIAELEAQKRIDAEMKAIRDADEKNKTLDSLSHTDLRYRNIYSYTKVIVCCLSFYFPHQLVLEQGFGDLIFIYCLLPILLFPPSAVTVKVLRPDAAQGRSQFHQEVEVLSCIRHPNMVLLLGACPEYGCLVYEYMANESLEDRLFR
ncbi:unnamed protein product [Musa textilis]